MYNEHVKIYCSGIGGIGLSAYASLRRAEGESVAGSDRSNSPLIRELQSQGISISLDQSGGALSEDVELFVYSEAVNADAPERRRARELGIEELSYPQALGRYLRGKEVIAVCGTHGKSSTTSMVARVFLACGMDPTIVVGTKMKELDGRNWRKGNGKIAIIEACEYRRSFLAYTPSTVLLTTCDGDHFDYYTSIEDYRNAFVEFLSKMPLNGAVITHLLDPDCARVARASKRVIVDADSQPLIPLKTPGKHMRRNAQLALALAEKYSLPMREVQEALAGYAGSWRRLEHVGFTRQDIPVIDDYAHHPVEIAATIDAVREEYPDRRLICVFQPHTHDRTRKLYNEFTKAFAGANTVIIPNIYVARKEPDATLVNVQSFTNDIAAKSAVHAVDGRSLEETENLLRTEVLQNGDVLLIMGAGDITSLAQRMISDNSV